METVELYTDGCLDELKTKLIEQYNINVIVRDTDNWNISYATKHIMTPEVQILVFNFMNEIAIAEIALASFMCKTILVTNRSIEEYPTIKDLATDIDYGCTLLSNKTSFFTWLDYKRGR